MEIAAKQNSINNVFITKNELIILALTGRTGSGCSTVASILRKEKFSDLNLCNPKTCGFSSTDERKYSIIYNYIKSKDNWVPFTVIQASSIILSYVIDTSFKEFMNYLSRLRKNTESYSLEISDFVSLGEKIKGIQYIFKDSKRYDLSGDITYLLDPKDADNEIKLDKYYRYYIEKLPKYKDRIKRILEDYTCYEYHKSRFEEPSRTRAQLYTFLMQNIGNNIRSSGNPFADTPNQSNYYLVSERIDKVIRIVEAYNRQKNINSTRICIDAIRNPFEAFYFRSKYNNFNLVSVNTDDNDRKKRLSTLDEQELDSLDRVEYPEKFSSDNEIFYHQNIGGCLETSDIHLFNPNEDQKNLVS